MAEVTIVGAGLGGLAAALRLLERGFSVEVIEQNAFPGGKWGAHRRDGGTDYHEHCYHMVLNWYHNLWDIVDELGVRGSFEPCREMRYLRAGEFPRTTAMRDVGAPGTVLGNLFSGALPPADAFVYGYSLVDLLGRRFVRSDFLDQYPVNGFMRSRGYATDEAALHHQRTLAKAFASPSYATAASTYRNFIRYGFAAPSPMMWMLKGNSHEVFFAPLMKRLESFGDRFAFTGLTRVAGLVLDPEGRRVTALELEAVGTSPSVRDGSTPARGRRRVEVGELILAIPARALAALVDAEVYAADPRLGDVKKLRSEPMASLDLYFRRRLPGVPRGITVLMDARYELTFVDNAQLWPGHDATYLNVVASDFDMLLGLPTGLGEDGAAAVDLERPRSVLDHLLAELRRFVPFEVEDLDLPRTYLQTNVGEELIVNEVGSWALRPDTRTRIANLTLAGDYVRTEIDAVTLEGAAMSGLMAAEAVRARAGRGAPIPIKRPKAYPEAAMAALAFVGLPWAYAAKVASVAGGEAWRTYAEVFGDD